MLADVNQLIHIGGHWVGGKNLVNSAEESFLIVFGFCKRFAHLGAYSWSCFRLYDVIKNESRRS